jgi:hypothetical protein
MTISDALKMPMWPSRSNHIGEGILVLSTGSPYLARYRGLQRRGKGFEPSGGVTHRSQHKLAAALTNGNLSAHIVPQSHLILEIQLCFHR